MRGVTQHLIERTGGAAVEIFQAPALSPAGAILFVHGNQGGRLVGAREAVDNGALLRFSSRLGVTAAAVSQPGFGASDGPADFCGPATQEAIIAALFFLAGQPSVDPQRLVIYGNSRGAVAAAMVAARYSELRAVILSGGVYNLKAVFIESSRGLRQVIRMEAGLSDEAFLARSALHHVDKIRPEILLLHGRRDDRAPVAQAERFSDALSGAGVQVTLSLFDCGHRIPREDAQGVLLPFLNRIFGTGRKLH